MFALDPGSESWSIGSGLKLNWCDSFVWRWLPSFTVFVKLFKSLSILIQQHKLSWGKKLLNLKLKLKSVFDYGLWTMVIFGRDTYWLRKFLEVSISGSRTYPVLTCQAVVVNWCLAASLPTPPTHLCRGWGGSSKSTRLYAGCGALLWRKQNSKKFRYLSGYIKIKINTSHASFTWVGTLGRKLNSPLWWEWRKLKVKNQIYLSGLKKKTNIKGYIRI